MSWIDSNKIAPGAFFRPHSRELAAFDNVKFIDEETGEVTYHESMTKQSEMDACDIHNVLKQFSQQGFEALVREKAATGQYADLPDEIDYQNSLNIVLAAQASFATLPSQVRERFANDPARFLDFLANPDNREDAVRMGLVEAPAPEPGPTRVEIVNPAPEPEKPA